MPAAQDDSGPRRDSSKQKMLRRRWRLRGSSANSRISERGLPLTLLFAGSALLALLASTGLAIAGVELGLTLTLVGLMLALLVPLGIEVRSHATRKRQIVVIDSRAHQYGHAIARGVHKVLYADRRAWQVKYQPPASASSDGSLQRQVGELHAAIINDVDGVVLIPACDDRSLWDALAAAIKSGIFVVVVDTKPPNKIFREIGIEAPRFVSSRYSETGVLVAEILEEWLREHSNRLCILWIGPDGSWPGEERSRNIIYELSRHGYRDRTILLPIDSWRPDASRCRTTLDLIKGAAGDVAIYCADDENASALHLLTMTEQAELRSRMFIIGCNGTPDEWGHVQVLETHAAEATVDILAEGQGEQAATLMVQERAGKLQASQTSVYINPRILRRSAMTGTWIEELFGSETADAADELLIDEPHDESPQPLPPAHEPLIIPPAASDNGDHGDNAAPRTRDIQ